MRDGRIPQHALDVGLRNGHDVADEQRQHAHHHHHALPDVVQAAEPVDENPQSQRQSRQLRCRGDVERHGRARALINVRQPHVERHAAKLERDAHHHERDAEPERHVIQLRIARHRRGQLVELQRARDAVDPRDAVQQRTRRDRAEDKVLHGGLGRRGRVALERDQGVERQRQRFQPEIHRQQAVRRHHDHHAQQAEQPEHVVFAAQQLVLPQIVARVEEADRDDTVTANSFRI